jgi:hypothetical protein
VSLPLQAVDRLFERLSATYGRQFLNLYEGMDANAIKAVWAYELSGFGMRLAAIAWALENLPERAPNAIEFRNLARRAPEPEKPRLPEPKANPERVRAELAKLQPLLTKPAPQQVDRLAWAKRIVARYDAGDRVAMGTLNIARDALRMNGLLREPDADETPLSGAELEHGVSRGLIDTAPEAVSA